MAETALTATALTLNTASANLAISGGTAIDADKTMVVSYPIQGKLLLILNNTTAATKVFTINAGEFLGNGIGSLDISMAQNDVKYIVIDSIRHKKFNGKIEIDFADSTTGFVRALALP